MTIISRKSILKRCLHKLPPVTTQVVGLQTRRPMDRKRVTWFNQLGRPGLCLLTVRPAVTHKYRVNLNKKLLRKIRWIYQLWRLGSILQTSGPASTCYQIKRLPRKWVMWHHQTHWTIYCLSSMSIFTNYTSAECFRCNTKANRTCQRCQFGKQITYDKQFSFMFQAYSSNDCYNY